MTAASVARAGDAQSSRTKSELGLVRLLGLHYYVRNLERSRRFYTQCLDFR